MEGKKLKNKSKTSYEIFLLWNEQVDKRKWVWLEDAEAEISELVKICALKHEAMERAFDHLKFLEGQVAQFREWLDLMYSTSVVVSFDDAREKFAEVFGGLQSE